MGDPRLTSDAQRYYPADQTALILIDCHGEEVDRIQDQFTKQNFIISALAVLEKARKNGIPVIHCLVDTDVYADPINRYHVDWLSKYKPHYETKPELALEYPKFALRDSSTGAGVEKTFYRPPGFISALSSADLERYLRDDLGVKHLILCGFETSMAVLATAMQASDLHFLPTVIQEATYCRNKDLHNLLFNEVFTRFGYVSSKDRVIELLGSK